MEPACASEGSSALPSAGNPPGNDGMRLPLEIKGFDLFPV
jgi:hypothetical protein